MCAWHMQYVQSASSRMNKNIIFLEKELKALIGDAFIRSLVALESTYSTHFIKLCNSSKTWSSTHMVLLLASIFMVGET